MGKYLWIILATDKQANSTENTISNKSLNLLRKARMNQEHCIPYEERQGIPYTVPGSARDFFTTLTFICSTYTQSPVFIHFQAWESAQGPPDTLLTK